MSTSLFEDETQDFEKVWDEALLLSDKNILQTCFKKQDRIILKKRFKGISSLLTIHRKLVKIT